jgi:EAL domain-containing protein (putative c-di-GMP-specific phosphodiesterase class I)
MLMRTKVLDAPSIATPRLERAVGNGQPPEVIELDRFPFTVGRNETCDYQIASTRVSREHAELLRQGDTFRVRDLQSTNGTFLNGQRITGEAPLRDGDLLVIADVEFCFCNRLQSAGRITVTQVMDAPPEDDSDTAIARDFVAAVRSLQESLLHRAARNRFQPIVDLTDGQTVGFEALPRQPQGIAPLSTSDSLLAVECRLTERFQHVHRLMAVEQAAKIPGDVSLLLSLRPAEVGADALPHSLARLQSMLQGRAIIAGIPDSAVADIPYFRHFLDRLRELGLKIAYDGFAAGHAQIKAHRELAPDYVKLAPLLARGVDRSSERQRQLSALVQAAGEIGSELIITGIHSENEAQTCRELGCRLAQGDHYGRPQTIDWPAPDNASVSI